MTRLLVVVPSDTDPPARLGEWLTAAGLELDERHLDAGDPVPADLSGHDGLLVLGGPQSSLDDTATELAPVRDLLARAAADDVPTLAICLGAQLLAQATGGATRVRPDGPEVGATLVARRDAAETDPVFTGLPLSPDVIAWHHDEVERLPSGAVVLAANPVCDIQAYRVGSAVYGLQFHIETTPEIAASWAEHDPVGVASTGLDVEVVSALAAAAHPDLAEVWAPFAGRFAELVRSRAAVR
ncbi:type 1 glutamine amidotransferase [Klenkia terrae]|uniref:Type 1 glutamine amidotransferase n=1 Tax=Klenkia terrae TaxID=1052259 RepID=A0ABU8E4L7_9ACTN|nr:type 1 glutamine amidotransferase [Klenkia terrae]